MVDLERHSVVDVLEDRRVESAKAWLQERPTIEVDRCGLYAQAAREGAPQARQVADRFHLVQNLREAIKEQMSVYAHAHVRPILSEDAIASARSQQRRARLAHRQSRQEIFDTLQALRQQGLTYSEIARRTGYERRSIANWLASDAPRDRNRAALNPTSPLYFQYFLAECWKKETGSGGICFTISRTAVTRAAALIWSAC
ncbi:transposase [Rhizobium mesoamericanum]|nr:transposase [Rhizobium mesoamericanum]